MTTLRGFLLWLLMSACAPLACAAGFDEAIAGLAEVGFPAKVAAVQALAASGDPRAKAVLEALKAGALLVQSGQVVLKQNDSEGKAILTEAPITLSGAKKITLNNQMRAAIDVALSAMSLVGGSPAERLAGLSAWIRNPPANLPTDFATRMEAESDAEIKAAMRLVLALVDARSSDPGRRAEAVATLARSMRDEARNRLEEIAADATVSAEVKGEVRRALAGIDQQRAIYGFFETVYFGMSLGSVLALCAIGLAVTFGVMGVINMAHGEMMMLGAYTTFVVQQGLPGLIEWSVLLAMPLAFVVTGLTGVAIERGIVSRLYGRPLETLLATFGVSLFLQQLVRTQFGATNQAVEAPTWMRGQFELFEGLSFTWNRLYIMFFCLLVFLALVFILRATAWGLQIRAVAQNRQMARALGVSSARVNALTFGLGSGIAGLAGVALSQITNVGPNLGQSYIVDAFMVVVFGGVGSVWGTLVAGLCLGMLNKLIEPAVGAVLAKVLVLVGIILFIQRYPRGLFPLKGRAAEA